MLTKLRLVTLCSTLCILGSSALAQIHYVVPWMGPDGSGKSWEDPFTKIRSALSVAKAGEEIWVARGGVPFDITNQPFVIPAGVKVIGGLALGTLLPYRDAQSGSGLGSTAKIGTLIMGHDSTIVGFHLGNLSTDVDSRVILIRGTKATIDDCFVSGSSSTDALGTTILIDADSKGQPAELLVMNTQFNGSRTVRNLGRGKSPVVAVTNSNAIFLNCMFGFSNGSTLLVSGTSNVEVVNCTFYDSGTYAVENTDTQSVIQFGHNASVFRVGNRQTGPMLYHGVKHETLAAINALPGWGNHVFGGDFLDRGMLHAKLPATDCDGRQRVLDNSGNGFARPDIGKYEVGPILYSPTTVKPGTDLILSSGGPIYMSAGITSGFPLAGFGKVYLGGYIYGPYFTSHLGTRFPVPSTVPIGTTIYLQGLSLGSTPLLTLPKSLVFK